jgi:hypothetical protein
VLEAQKPQKVVENVNREQIEFVKQLEGRAWSEKSNLRMLVVAAPMLKEQVEVGEMRWRM